MDKSTVGFRIEELDQLLNELERMAHSQASRLKFYSALLERLRFVLSASGAAFAVPLDSDRWGVLASSGNADFKRCIEELPKELTEHGVQSRPDSTAQAGLVHGKFITTFISPKQPKRGAIIVQLSGTPDSAAAEEIAGLCQAFGEIASIRQSAETEKFLDSKWPAFQLLQSDISQSESAEQAATLLVNELLTILKADRVSLIHRGLLQSSQVLAVSQSTNLEHRSSVIKALEAIGQQVIDTGKSVSKIDGAPQSSMNKPVDDAFNRPPNDSLDNPDKLVAPGYIAFPLGKTHTASGPTCSAAVLVEWHDYERLVLGASLLNLIVPTLNVLWLEHSRWLKTPRTARALVNMRLGRVIEPSSRRWMKFATGLLVFFTLIWIATRPYDLRIEMQGVLEPESQRTIYAALDGVVTQVMVRDSSQVEKGQVLLIMRSPSLEIQIEETQGELKANREKRDSLALNINQLARDSSASQSTLNQLSSEIKQLETIKDTLELKLAALREEEGHLSLRAPMNGIVIGRDLDHLLSSRPLRRGDAIFRIVNPDGPWRLQLSIADSDAGYVKSKLFAEDHVGGGDVPEHSERSVDFVFVSKPDTRFSAEITWIADSARNPRGDGVFVDAVAALATDVVNQEYVGASVQAFMVCGKRPLWFVFSRPLIEAIQRKLWF